MLNRTLLASLVVASSVTGFATFVTAQDHPAPSSILATASHAEFVAVTREASANQPGVSDLLRATTLPMQTAASSTSVAQIQ